MNRGIIILLLMLSSFTGYSQQKINPPSQEILNQMTLRPNSRDFSGNYRNNIHQRIIQNNKNLQMNKQMNLDKRRAVIDKQKSIQQNRMKEMRKKRMMMRQRDIQQRRMRR